MDSIIQYVSYQNISNIVYDCFGLLGILVAFIFCIRYSKRIDLEIWKSVLIFVVVLFVTFFSIHVIILLCLDYLSNNTSIPIVYITSIIRTLLLIPMIGLWMSKILRIKWSVVCDILAFLPLIIGSIGCFGCIFEGCCRGYPCDWGIYNSRIGVRVFPVQILNAIIMALIAAFLFARSKKHNFISDGLSYPIMLMLFGSTRFITEYLCDNRKIMLGLSVLSVHVIKDFIVGLVAYLIIRHKAKASDNVVSRDHVLE